MFSLDFMQFELLRLLASCRPSAELSLTLIYTAYRLQTLRVTEYNRLVVLASKYLSDLSRCVLSKIERLKLLISKETKEIIFR